MIYGVSKWTYTASFAAKVIFDFVKCNYGMLVVVLFANLALEYQEPLCAVYLIGTVLRFPRLSCSIQFSRIHQELLVLAESADH